MPQTNGVGPRSEPSRINQYTRIEKPPGIKRTFHRPQRRGKEFRTLLVVPAAMVAPDRVMMRNRPSRFHKRIGSGDFYRPELFDQRRLVAQGAKGKVDSWSTWVDVGKTATDQSFLPGRLSHRSFCCFLDRRIEVRELFPGDSRLKGVGDDATRRQFFAQGGHAEKALAPLPGSPAPVRALLVDCFSAVFPAIVRAQLKRTLQPCVYRVIGGFEGQEQHRVFPIPYHIRQRLKRIE